MDQVLEGMIYQLNSKQWEAYYRIIKKVSDGKDGFINCYYVQNIKSGWTMYAHGLHIYPGKFVDKIDWEYSTGGHFEDGKDVD